MVEIKEETSRERRLRKKREYGKKYYIKYKEKILLKYKTLPKEKKEKKLIYWKEYLKRPEVIERNLKIRKKLYANKHKFDLNWKLKNNLRSRIRLSLKGKNKSKKTMELLGCTIKQLWEHLESKFKLGMTRENHGKWHIDHIKPCISFNLTDPEQQKICFHYTNLQPLWAEDNLKKGAKYD